MLGGEVKFEQIGMRGPEVEIGFTMKVILWDFDGTLAFRQGMWSTALAEVAPPGTRRECALSGAAQPVSP